MYRYVVTRIGGTIFLRDAESFREKNGVILKCDRTFRTFRGALAFARRASGPLGFPIRIEVSAYYYLAR